MADNKISLYQGNSDTIFVSVLDSSANQMNLHGYSGTLTVKKRKRDAAATLSYNNSSVDASEGVFIFEILSTDTSIASDDYSYDITIVNSSTNKVFTVVQDRFSILDSVRY